MSPNSGIRKHRVGYCMLVVFHASVFICATTSWAEKAPLPPEKMVEMATHVVTGKVQAVYSYETKDAEWQTWYSVAEVKVNKVEKGTGIKPGQLVYVRSWHRRWIGTQRQPPGTNGHTGIAGVGQTARFYLVNKGYDGNDEVQDGGFNVVFRNGCEILGPGK